MTRLPATACAHERYWPMRSARPTTWMCLECGAINHIAVGAGTLWNPHADSWQVELDHEMAEMRKAAPIDQLAWPPVPPSNAHPNDAVSQYGRHYLNARHNQMDPLAAHAHACGAVMALGWKVGRTLMRTNEP